MDMRHGHKQFKYVHTHGHKQFEYVHTHTHTRARATLCDCKEQFDSLQPSAV